MVSRFVYSRENITLILDVSLDQRETITIKKNGLTIEIPLDILEDFSKYIKAQLDQEGIEMLNALRSFKKNDKL